ncbi:hypothetical protein MMC22_007930 [Lobaria immixta]|nr:hypothetical protein [Lobaria immixta]
MGHRASEILHLTTIVVFLCLLRPAIAQAIDPDSVDYTVITGWTDLRECLRVDYFNNGLGGCSAGTCSGPNNANLDDIQLANDSLRTYCSIKGYTSVGAPTLLPGDANATDTAGAYRTVTVYEPTTAFISHATKRVEVAFGALPELPWEKSDVARFNYGPWVGSLVLRQSVNGASTQIPQTTAMQRATTSSLTLGFTSASSIQISVTTPSSSQTSSPSSTRSLTTTTDEIDENSSHSLELPPPPKPSVW